MGGILRRAGLGPGWDGPPAGSGYFRAIFGPGEIFEFTMEIRGGIKREKRHSDAFSMSKKEGGLERHKLNG